MSCYRTVTRLLGITLLVALSADVAAAQQRSEFGTLSIQVRPPDAEVFIDGERWAGPEATGPLNIQLTAGTHRVEIRSPGRQTFVRDVTIRTGETLSLNVALTQREPAVPPDYAPPPPPRRAPQQPVPAAGRPSRVTTNEDGFVFAPDFRVTEVADEIASFIGAYGGYVFGGQVLVGAGGYWQANSTNGTRLVYGGPVVQWRMFPDRTIGFNLHALFGGGWRYADYGHAWDDDYYHHPAPRGWGYPPYYWYDEGFFVAEPEAQVVIRFSPSIRLQGGLGYRAASADGVSGASGSISIQFGR